MAWKKNKNKFFRASNGREKKFFRASVLAKLVYKIMS
jgi:hypothetical protein